VFDLWVLEEGKRRREECVTNCSMSIRRCRGVNVEGATGARGTTQAGRRLGAALGRRRIPVTAIEGRIEKKIFMAFRRKGVLQERRVKYEVLRGGHEGGGNSMSYSKPGGP